MENVKTGQSRMRNIHRLEIAGHHTWKRSEAVTDERERNHVLLLGNLVGDFFYVGSLFVLVAARWIMDHGGDGPDGKASMELARSPPIPSSLCAVSRVYTMLACSLSACTFVNGLPLHWPSAAKEDGAMREPA